MITDHLLSAIYSSTYHLHLLHRICLRDLLRNCPWSRYLLVFSDHFFNRRIARVRSPRMGHLLSDSLPSAYRGIACPQRRSVGMNFYWTYRLLMEVALSVYYSANNTPHESSEVWYKSTHSSHTPYSSKTHPNKSYKSVSHHPQGQVHLGS